MTQRPQPRMAGTPPTSPGLFFPTRRVVKTSPGLVGGLSLTCAVVWCSWACFPCTPYPCIVIRECHEPPVPDNHEDRSPVCLCRGVILRACPLQTEAEAVPVLYPCRHPRFLLRCADKLHTRSSRFLFCLHYVLAHCVHYSVIRRQKKEGVSASSSSCVSCSYMLPTIVCGIY